MKNKLLVLILLLICIFSFNVFAEETGKLIVKSGDGTKLGDEVCLDDQCFYVIENDGETAKLLSKYNLYNGWVYQYEDVEQETTQRTEASSKCYQPNYGSGCINKLLEQINLTNNDIYYSNRYEIKTDDNNNTYFRIYYFTFLDADEFKQSSEAIGLHGGDENNRTPEFPEVAVFNMSNSNIDSWDAYYLYSENDETEYVKDGERYSYTLQDFNFKEDIYFYGEEKNYGVLGGYEEYLDDQGLTIKDINILSLTDINNIAKEVTGSDLPLDEWSDGREYVEGENGHSGVYIYGSLKEELGNDYSWLWGTTYWLRTYDKDDYFPGVSILFVESIGNICSDRDCVGMVGAGVRPVIEVDAKDIVKPKQEIIVNPETGGVIAITILGLLGIGLFSLKLNKRNN